MCLHEAVSSYEREAKKESKEMDAMKFQEFEALVARSRTRRRFDERVKVTEETLTELIGLARLCPSAANLQALRFVPVSGEAGCSTVFEHLVWAAALPEWPGPAAGERPTGYILILCDQSLAKQRETDDGICVQTMMLGANAMGLGGCMFGSVKRDALMDALALDKSRYHLDLVLAIGKPVEDVRIVDAKEGGSLKYYRDAEGVHYVPKRSLKELIVKPGTVWRAPEQ